MPRTLALLLALALLTPHTAAQIVVQTGIDATPWLHHEGPGADVLVRGTSTVGAGPHSLSVPAPVGDVVLGIVTWSLGANHLQSLPLTDTVQIDGHSVAGVLCGEASPAPDWHDFQLGVYVGLLPAAVVPGGTWTLTGVSAKPLGADPDAHGYALSVVLVTELPGFPQRSIDVWCGYASTDSDSVTPQRARAELDLSHTYVGGGLHLVLDALDGQVEDGSGYGADSFSVQGHPAGGVVSGTVAALDAWQGQGPGPGGYDLMDDDPTLYALVLPGTTHLSLATDRLAPVGDSIGHSLAAAAHDLLAGAWTSAGPGSAPGDDPAPLLAATGPLTPGSANALLVAGAPAGGTVQFVAGAPALLAPFKGGVLGPTPLLIVPVPADAAGRATLGYTWPSLPAGLQLWAQAWMNDAGVWRSTRTLRGTSG